MSAAVNAVEENRVGILWGALMAESQTGVEGPYRSNRCPNLMAVLYCGKLVPTYISTYTAAPVPTDRAFNSKFLAEYYMFVLYFATDQLSKAARKADTCRWIICRLGPPMADRLSTLASKLKTSWTSSVNFSFKLRKSCNVSSLSWQFRDSASATARPEM